MCAKRNFNSLYISHCFLKINSDNCVFGISSDNYLHINSLLLIAVTIIPSWKFTTIFESPRNKHEVCLQFSDTHEESCVNISYCICHFSILLDIFGYTQEKNGWFTVYVWQIIILFIIIYSYLSLPPAVWLAGLSSGKCIYLNFSSIKSEQKWHIFT